MTRPKKLVKWIESVSQNYFFGVIFHHFLKVKEDFNFHGKIFVKLIFFNFTRFFGLDIFKFHLNLYLNFFFIFLIAPTKRRSVSGSTSILGNGLDSPCSSRASVAGSSVSEAWSTASTAAMTDMTDMVEASAGVQPSQPPQSNMVLRKRIRR